MTRTRIVAALIAGLAVAGVGTAAAALPDDPARPAPATLALARAADDTPISSTTTPAPAGTTTADEAGRTAVARLGGGTVAKVEREDEHGRQVWEVDVRRGSGVTRVHVDVATGAVSRVEDHAGDDRTASTRTTSTGTSTQRAGDDHGRQWQDDGPGHDRGDDHGGRR